MRVSSSIYRSSVMKVNHAYLDLLYTFSKKLINTSLFIPLLSSTSPIFFINFSYDSFSYASNRSGMLMGGEEKISLTRASACESFRP